MPFAVLLAVLYCMYAVAPVVAIDSFSIACIYVFLIMIWAGLTYNNLEDEVSEQILVLRTQSGWKYYISDSLFLIVLGFMVAAISALFPMLLNLVHQGHLFSKPVGVSDVISALLLQWASAFVGSAIGTFFHPRVMKDRKMAILLTALVAILSVAELGILQWHPEAKYVTWIFPPVAQLAQSLCGYDAFYMGQLLHAILIMVIYGVVVTLIKVGLLQKNKF
jgi:hypothetical protein